MDSFNDCVCSRLLTYHDSVGLVFDGTKIVINVELNTGILYILKIKR